MPRQMNLAHTRLGWKAEKNNNDSENSRNSTPKHEGGIDLEDIINPTDYDDEPLDSVEADDYEPEFKRRGKRNNVPPRAISVARVVSADKKSLQKQLQKLTRKLQEINELQAAKENGKILKPEQETKLSTKADVEVELAKVQAELTEI